MASSLVPNQQSAVLNSNEREKTYAMDHHFTFSFNAELQDGDAEPQGRNCLPFQACFYARGVSALIAPTSTMNAGRNVVDCGHLLIQ